MRGRAPAHGRARVCDLLLGTRRADPLCFPTRAAPPPAAPRGGWHPPPRAARRPGLAWRQVQFQASARARGSPPASRRPVLRGLLGEELRGEVEVQVVVVPHYLLEAFPEHPEFADQLLDRRVQHELDGLGPALPPAPALRPPDHAVQRLVLVRRIADAHDVLPGLVRVLRVEPVDDVLEGPGLPPRRRRDALRLIAGARRNNFAVSERGLERRQPRLAAQVDPPLLGVCDDDHLFCELGGLLQQHLGLVGKLRELYGDLFLRRGAQNREAVSAHASRGGTDRVIPVENDDCLVRLVELYVAVRGLAGQGCEVEGDFPVTHPG
mmetsp:Transcript_105364/g.298234  ORF Transcript_105364/g.298234 Transcript_105364/m.298234 type:complete len:323 (+) Transcript_105364:327-1295(+)